MRRNVQCIIQACLVGLLFLEGSARVCAAVPPEPPPWEQELQAGLEALSSLDPQEVVASETHLRQALSLSEKAGAPPARRAEILDALGQSLQTFKKTKDAEEVFLAALHLKKEAFGPDHPAVAQTLLKLASLEAERQNLKRSEGLMLQALEIQTKSLEVGHRERINTLLLLGGHYLVLGPDYSKAEAYYLEALREEEGTLGEDHPDFGLTLTMLEDLYKESGQEEKRKKIRQRDENVRIREAAENPQPAPLPPPPGM